MAITPVGGAGNSSNTAVTTLTVTYAPTAGNAVMVYVVLPASAQAITVKDSANNVLTQIANNSSFQYLLYQLNVPSGITGYTVSFATGEAVSIQVEEYSGANLVLAVPSGATGGGTASSLNVTAATPDPGDFLIGGFVALNPQTVTNGTARQNRTFNTNFNCIILDNTSATSPTNISITTTFTSAGEGWVSGWLCNRTFVAEEADGPNVWGEKITGSRVDVLQDCGTLGTVEFGEQIVYATSTGGLSNTPLWGSFSLDSGWVGLTYDDEWALEYCATPCTFSLVSGSLPTGLSLTSFGTASGRLSGTPSAAGTYSFTLRASNSFGTSDKSFSITISLVPPSGGGGSWTFFA